MYIINIKYHIIKPCFDHILHARLNYYFFSLFMHFCPGMMTTHAESINSDLQHGLDRRLRQTQP